MLSRRYLWIGIFVVMNLGAVQAQAETIQVTIDKLVFSPAAINAKIGDAIEWVNTDILDHTATVKGGWEVLMPAGKSASLVLQEVGLFEYYCRFHPNMKARVTVE